MSQQRHQVTDRVSEMDMLKLEWKQRKTEEDAMLNECIGLHTILDSKGDGEMRKGAELVAPIPSFSSVAEATRHADGATNGQDSANRHDFSVRYPMRTIWQIRRNGDISIHDAPSGTKLHTLRRLKGDVRPSIVRHVPPIRPRAPAVRLFDAISIYKVDIEGFEFNVIPSWSRDELVNIATENPALVAKGAVETFDFEDAASDFMTISLFSMEFHRMGHKKAIAASRVGALRAHYLLLHLYSLGFLMVGHEKNQYDHCCYEQAWSHVRHFVRSETWMVAREHF